MSIKLIKDTILQNIIFSKFEGLLFSNQLINRLHYITQNSMAFRVFPADRTARFIHSTGVMHLASEIFRNGLSNTDHTILKKFIEEKRNLIKAIVDENIDKLPDFGPDKIREETRAHSCTALRLLGDKLNDILGESFVNHSVFYNDVFCIKENYATYLILLTSLRAMGLLHDIGHLPFSHLAEFALEDVLFDLETKKDRGIELNQKENEIALLIKSFTSVHGEKIHETVAIKLIELFFVDIEEQIKQNSVSDDKIFTLLFVKVIKSLILEIKKGKDGSLFSLYSIVASDFDADRLDFVMRDGLASGLIDKTGDVDRIIKMYCLCENPKANDLKDKFIFLPSVQCLNDVQQVLLDRYRIYKFLINHHKVKKMDYILQKAMTLLMEEECGTDTDETGAALEFKRMSDMVRVTARVMDTQLNPDNVMRTKYQFAQLTENWAYSILNKKYIDLLISNQIRDRRLKTLRLLLDEIFTGRKVFESLWKREHEFCDFINELLNNKIKSSEESKKALMDKIESIKDTNKGQLILKDIRETDENLGKLAIRYLNVCCAGWQKDIEGLLSNDDLIVLIQTARTETGISDLFLVDLKNLQNKYDFKNISKVYDYLCLDSDSSTKFYVYYADIGHNHNKTKITEMLTDEIIKYIKKQTSCNTGTGNDNN